MNISYYGYFSPFGGYGIANLSWVKYLRRAGVGVSVNAKFIPRPGTQEWEVLSSEEREMFGEFKERRIGIIEATPDHFHLNKCEIKIANTMAETDEIGPKWVGALNSMHYVIVPNDFYRRVFKKCGVFVPIKVIPHGIDTKRFKYFERSRRKRQTYIFGCCGYLNDRKGVFELIRAFSSEFNDNEPVKLRLHSTDPNLGFYSNMKDKRIEVTTKLWDFDKLVEWYHDLDCFVFPSKAEGVGYPPREAMATGLPTILTNYSGLEDIASLGISLTPTEFVKANPMVQQPGNWAKIDIPELMGAMRHMYDNKDYSYVIGKAASKEIHKNHSWEKCVGKLTEFLDEV